MNRGKRIFLACLIFSVIMTSTAVKAQISGTGALWQPPPINDYPLTVPARQDPSSGKGDILIDNFEYWDSPSNHGWIQLEPPYPVYGFGLGYATIFQTTLDLQEGGRVLDVYRPSSIFLLSTAYEKHKILYNLYTPPVSGDDSAEKFINITENPVLSFKFKAPIGIEPWDIFEFEIRGETKAGYNIIIRILPLQPANRNSSEKNTSTFTINAYQCRIVDADFHDGSMVIQINIGRNYLDGAWHIVGLNLKDTVQGILNYYEDTFDNINISDWELVKARQILIRGRMFRLDDILFKTKNYSKIDIIDAFRPGPLYAQLFEPYRFLFMVDYKTKGPITHLTDLLLDQNNFLTDPDEIRETWIADLLALDPNYHQIDPNSDYYDPNFTDRWVPGHEHFGKPDPVAERYLRKGFFIDCTLPLFSDPDFRIGGKMAAELRNHGTLGWIATVGGYGENGIQTSLIHPLPINAYDGMPTYLPNKGFTSAYDAIENYKKMHYGPTQCLILESALWNSGVAFWPHIAYMDFTPQYFEDLIVTLEITNGISSEVLTFPISVVNYSVENYPPVVQSKKCP